MLAPTYYSEEREKVLYLWFKYGDCTSYGSVTGVYFPTREDAEYGWLGGLVGQD